MPSPRPHLWRRPRPRCSATLAIAPAFVSLALALTGTGPLPGQNAWSPMPGTGPTTREGHAMAYDAQRDEIVLFGGHDGSAALGDTWRWSGSAWSQSPATGPGTGPTARSDHAMAYDARRDRVVLFGGHDGAAAAGDTWLWDGSSWSIAATAGPTPRSAHAMAYDARRGQVVLFGGDDGATALSDTWLWDGRAWTQTATVGPAPRSSHAMADDPLDGQVVLFGGANSAARFGDTWVWDGSSWSQVTSTGPTARADHAMTFDAFRGRVMLFGGDGGGPVLAAETWQWDRTAWVQVATAGPTQRAGHAMVHDAKQRRVTLFGGNAGNVVDDTWTLACTPWCDLGHDTPGTHGNPLLQGLGKVEPGTGLVLALSNARAQSTAFLVIGVTSSYFPFLGGTIVPNPAQVVPVPTQGTVGAPSTVFSSFTLPAGARSGVTLYFQYWIADPGAQFGLAVSNAIVGTTRLTLFDEISAGFDAMLARAAPPSSSLAIYSLQDFNNLAFVRNPACWTDHIDLTGISPWNKAGANRLAGTLVSPRHVVFAKHYPLSATPGNNDIAFVTDDDVTVIRQVVSVTYPVADIGVGLLNADVPSTIRHHKVLGQNWSTTLQKTAGLPMLHLDQEEKALVRDMRTTNSGASYSYHNTSVNLTRRQFSETLIGGDSGNPAFLLVNGEAVLVLTHHYATGGPFYTSHRNAVNAAMSQLGGGYQLTEVDLSRVPR